MDKRNGTLIEIEHPILFRIISIAVLVGVQVVALLLCFVLNLFDSKYWDIIYFLIKIIVIGIILLYIRFGGNLYRWTISHRDFSNNSFVSPNESSKKVNLQGIGKRTDK